MVAARNGLSIVPDLPTFDQEQSALWLPLSAIDKISASVNETPLPVLELGTGTLRAVSATFYKKMGDLLVRPHELMDAAAGSDIHDTSEERLAIGVGFTIGKAIAREANRQNGEQPDGVSLNVRRARARKLLPKIQAIGDGSDTRSSEGIIKVFDAVRNLELEEAHSDILAFRLQATRAHMRKEYRAVSTHPLSDEDIIRRQVFTHFGAVTGALLTVSTSRLHHARSGAKTVFMPATSLDQLIAS